MYNPVSTYRLQFHKKFTLADLDALLPYLQTLGVTTLYASPLFASAPDSLHGYDGVDPMRIDPEIGTAEELRSISRRLQQAGMGWLQDIVPNHMAYHPNNDWLMDVLEKGPLSRYASFFETSLSSSFFKGRVMAPFLPTLMPDTIAQHHLTLAYEQNRLTLDVNGNVLPLKPMSYAIVLLATDTPPNDAIQQLLTQLDQLHHLDEPDAFALAWNEWRLQLAALMNTTETDSYLNACLTAVNDNPALLEQLADEQHYRLCTEPESRQQMNYRRFFTVNGLICLAMQHEAVFDHYHSRIKSLVDDRIFQGLRVDHVDGLLDPTQYVEQLRALVGNDTYVVVEKILQDGEDLPPDWSSEGRAVAGTSGYEFLAMVNNLLTDSRSESAFRDFYHTLIETDRPLHDRIQDRKAYFLAQYMGGELDNLYHYFISQCLLNEPTVDDLATGELKLTIGEVLVRCPVYRYYGNQLPLPADEAQSLQTILSTIRDDKPDLTTAVNTLENALLTRPNTGDAKYNSRSVSFYQRLMQFTGPLMAKGVEDTLLYTYNCFVGHNEVGDSPERFGLSTDTFHRAMQDRQTRWPLAMNTTATHDTKRGEDVRARLNVLTALPDEWLAEVQHWHDLNHTDAAAPDDNDEYLIYQNLLGAYPMPRRSADAVDSPGRSADTVDSPRADDDDFPNRFRLYVVKALQEAKNHTTGGVVDDDYHTGVRAFVDRLLDPKRPFWARFRAFHHDVADFGITNSLVQTLLKFTCPGVPDTFQGAEGWDLSLVDPDNRRPVDFEIRQRWLTDLTARQQTNDKILWSDLWQHRFDGRIKFWLTRMLLHERRQNATLFAKGDYIPLPVEGTYRNHILAFARRHEAVCYVVAVPLYIARLCREQQADVLALDWQDTHIPLPSDMPSAYTNCLTGLAGHRPNALPLNGLFQELPAVLLRFTD